MPAKSLLESILLFPSPSSPDLGCFVTRKHGVQIEEGSGNIHVELNPSIDFHPSYHQIYIRVICGEAAFHQRCLMYMRSDLSIPGPLLTSFPPDAILGGDYTPRPSDWQKFPTQRGTRFYFFFGQHRNPASSSWQADALVAHSYDIYENGTLSTIRYDDAGGDRDLDDLVLEAAIVGRRSWRDVVQAVDQETVNDHVTSHVVEEVKSRLYQDESSDE
jgi:hypothetical protein